MPSENDRPTRAKFFRGAAGRGGCVFALAGREQGVISLRSFQLALARLLRWRSHLRVFALLYLPI